ncbi:Uncharacterised protein [Sphingobacterium spiritivorum]|uniref:Glycoside hydrolase n=2 Tax=Sphingobacterium spiritivorum TaxID=258 RepID=A0A380CUU6_SPHSI|nr:Uncharacterised protein [Sphingobacterium spiritivorum]
MFSTQTRIKNMNKVYTLLCALFCLAMTFSSCTKTEELTPLPEDKMLEYKVVNLTDDQVIYGAIDNQKNTITVYLPFYYGLSVIDPEIKLSNGAKLKEEILPIQVEATGTTYTVTAANGISRTYTLHIVLQSTPSLAVSWQTPLALSQSPGKTMPAILGNFAHSNAKLVKVTLINQENQKRYSMGVNSASLLTGEKDLYLLRFNGTEYIDRIPADIINGTYKVEVQSLGHTSLIAEPLTISYVQPDVYLPKSSIDLKKTDEWEIVPQSNTVFLGLQKVTATVNGKDYALPVKSWSRTALKVGFPTDFPGGNLPAVTVRFDFEGWKSVTLSAWLNITT